jgi:hypothetical protein
MGTLDTLQLVTETSGAPDGQSSAVGTGLIEQPKPTHSRTLRGLIRPMQLTRYGLPNRALTLYSRNKCRKTSSRVMTARWAEIFTSRLLGPARRHFRAPSTPRDFPTDRDSRLCNKFGPERRREIRHVTCDPVEVGAAIEEVHHPKSAGPNVWSAEPASTAGAGKARECRELAQAIIDDHVLFGLGNSGQSQLRLPAVS